MPGPFKGFSISLSIRSLRCRFWPTIFAREEWKNAAIVSPDVGRASMAGRYAQLLNLPLVVMHKRRTSFSVTETTHVVGEIAGIRPIIH